jgi:hypothetical protein
MTTDSDSANGLATNEPVDGAGSYLMSAHVGLRASRAGPGMPGNGNGREHVDLRSVLRAEAPADRATSRRLITIALPLWSSQPGCCSLSAGRDHRNRRFSTIASCRSSERTAPLLWRQSDRRDLRVSDPDQGPGWWPRTVERARAGKLTGNTARAKTVYAKLTAYAVKHARAQLRAAGIRPATDHEALLATYLNHQNAPAPQAPPPRLCAGCGQPIQRGRRGPAPKWHSDTCRKRATRASERGRRT